MSCARSCSRRRSRARWPMRSRCATRTCTATASVSRCSPSASPRSWGCRNRKREVLRVGAILHDVGKIGIPDSVLLKPGPLDADERRVMEEHPVIGDRLLEPLDLLASARPIVRNHHERWDGDGYPDGLAGEAIPLAGADRGGRGLRRGDVVAAALSHAARARRDRRRAAPRPREAVGCDARRDRPRVAGLGRAQALRRAAAGRIGPPRRVAAAHNVRIDPK